ncbi:15589_t:CDS:2 [Acaulospora morrowiae]|uniref:15589_t:CDS:1 n=1 Tax=Acaulospora morrowiae TaxID=94023 RepID=A0A9N9BC00_9GLOM|nr:15589_t:CDS:2 [Acaulospora morrowiae]
MVDSSLKETYQKSTLLTDEYETIAKRRPRRAATQSVSYHARPPRARTTRTSTRKQSQPRSLPAVETPPGDVDASDEGSQETDSLDIDGGIQAPPPPTRIRLRIQSPESSSSPPEKLPKLKRKAGRPRKNDPNSKRHRVTLTASNRDKLVEPSRPMDDTEEAQQADNEMDEKTLKIGVKKEQSSVNNVRKNKDEKSRDIKEEAAEEVEVLDEKGEQKITKDGELLGGRKYRVPVFQLESRGNTIFMCSMEPAKCLGFRDSYLFFSKNPSLKRIAATDQEREWLVANGYLPTNFRNRAITLVSARSIFKLFGHRIVLGGKRRKDDYFESNINYDESHNSDQGQDSELESANNILSRRANTNYIQNPRVLLNETNWMYHQALSCRDFNNRLNIHRSEKSKFYDPHTNTDQFPRDTQPTRIRVEMTSPMNYSARKNNAPAPIEPEVEFVPKIGNPHKTLSAEVLEVIPPEIREIVETMKKNEELAEYHVEDKYPLSLMDGQFQTSYPVYQTRFKPDIQNVPMATTSNMPITPETVATEEQSYFHFRKTQPTQAFGNQSFNQTGRNISQYSSSKANPQYICGVITATTGQPCRRAVIAEGEKCMYHKDSVQAPAFVGRSVNRNKPMNSVVNSVQTDIAGTSNMLPPTPFSLPPNACAICYSTVVPPNLQLPPKVSCSTEHITKCSQCHRKYHPICLGLTTPRLLVSIESYQWQCNDCKTCSVCKSSGDEATLLICDDCDRAWHLDCSEPKVTEVPQGPWLCSLCAQCDSCGEKATSLNDAASSYFHKDAIPNESNYPIHLATICSKCEPNFSADRFCPMCLKTYSEVEDGQENEDDKDMVCCDDCDSWIHARCDSAITPERYKELVEDPDVKYRCPLCEGRIRPLGKGDEEQLRALSGFPIAVPVSQIANGRYIRGVVNFKGKKVTVPEIRGWGKNNV